MTVTRLPFSAVVVSAPSGTGKTTLNRRLMREHPFIDITVSHTTRSPRLGEREGVHYHFVDEPTFQTLISQNAFVEWAQVHGSLYGTSKAALKHIQEQNKLPLLEIDVQGWLNARSSLPDALSIFILPPTLQALWHRLESRASDSLRSRMIRLNNAYHEIAKAENYQYFLVNDDLEIAYHKLKGMIVNGIPGDIDAVNGRELCERLKEEYHNAAWIKEVRAQLTE